MINAALFHRSQHLGETDLVPVDSGSASQAQWHRDGQACAFCGGTNRVPVWRLQQSPVIDLLLCQKCHAVSASRLPTQDALRAYYAQYYETDETSALENAVTFDAPERLAKHIARHVSLRGAKDVTILDFGGGDGSISFLIAQHLIEENAASAEVTVVDYVAKPVSSVDPRITVEVRPDLESCRRGEFSVVLASAVLEHFVDPGVLLSDLLSRVKHQGGLFYARTPYMLPFMRAAKVLGFTIDFTFPGHIHDLGQRFWETYFATQATAFTVIRSRPSIVETTFRLHFLRTLAAYVVKSPWWLLRSGYPFVGGWEVLAKR